MSKIFTQIPIRIKRQLLNYYYRDIVPNNSFNDDLFIVEFPKSGITWLSTILANTCFIEEKINIRATFYNLEQFIADVHISKNISANKIFPYYRIIKSHATFNPFYRHVIYIIRNPYNVMKSYYKYMLDNNNIDSEFIEFVRDKNFGIDRWVSHVNSWINPSNRLKLHLIRYEDLLNDTNNTIKNLYLNLGWQITDSNIEEAIELSRFDNMKKSDEHYINFNPFRSYSFVRKGKIDTDVDTDIEKLILEKSKNILKLFYPEYL